MGLQNKISIEFVLESIIFAFINDIGSHDCKILLFEQVMLYILLFLQFLCFILLLVVNPPKACRKAGINITKQEAFNDIMILNTYCAPTTLIIS